VLGTGDFTLAFGGFKLGGIGTATFGAIILYALLNRSTSTGVSVADAPNVETLGR
jgi:putative pyrimidine permease RutG